MPFLSGPAVNEHKIGKAAALPHLQPGLALFLDLPPTETISLAPFLTREGYYVIPVIQRWCSDPAVVPSSELVSYLFRHSRGLRRPREPKGAVFLLDGDRAGPKRPRLTDFDNRYRYNLNAFPPAEVLKRVGITSVRLVSRGEPSHDLWVYIAALRDGGMDVTLNEEKHLEGGRGHRSSPSRSFAAAQDDG